MVCDIMQKRTELKQNLSKSKSLSFQIHNFSRLITEFGTNLKICDIYSLDCKQLMSIEELNIV
jgi:hypothetical protein